MSTLHDFLWLLLACAWVGAGCVATSPDPTREARPGPVDARPDSTRSVPVDRDTTRRPSGGDGLVRALRAAYREGAYDAVVRRIRSRRRDDSLHSSASQALAEVYRRAQRWSKARAQYARLVRADASNGRWWARLGQCNLGLNQTERARRHFGKAHRRVPQSAEVALSLSRLHRAAGHLDAARRVVDTTLTHQSGDPRLWRRRADLAFERENLKRARRAYVQTLATGDSSATVYRRIGLADVRRQQYARALPFLRRSLRRDSSHARTTLYLGVTYLRLDSLRRASRYLQNTIDQEASGPITDALAHQGATYSRRGNVSAALEAYKTARRLRPGRAELDFRLATVYDEHYRDKAPAARYYRRFLRAHEGGLPELRRYAMSRLKALRPTLHMQ